MVALQDRKLKENMKRLQLGSMDKWGIFISAIFSDGKVSILKRHINSKI